MKERPILFSGPMVQAILAGKKTQTRRVVKPQPTKTTCAGQTMWGHQDLAGDFGEAVFPTCFRKMVSCPYGQPGDRLWVREAWFRKFPENLPEHILYRATWDGPIDALSWRPSIHMFRWASRLTLEITDVRVQRVQEIDYMDAEAEGIWVSSKEYREKSCIWRDCPEALRRLRIEAFQKLWDSINAKKGHGWDVNPFVWAITFRTVEQGKRRGVR